MRGEGEGGEGGEGRVLLPESMSRRSQHGSGSNPVQTSGAW